MGLEPRSCCPVCGDSSFRSLLDLPYEEPPIRSYLDRFYGGRVRWDALAAQRFALDRCLSCGLVFQRNVPGPQLLSELYERWIDHGEPDAAAAAKSFDARRKAAFQVIDLVRYFRRSPADLAVLDYGMGWGNWVEMAAAFGCAAEGAEFGLHQVADARARGLVTADPDRLEPDRYDFINTEQVFEHLAEPITVGERLTRALRRGGLLRISVPNGSDIDARLAVCDWDAPKGSAHSLNAVAPLEHLNTFDHRSLVALGTRLGLRPRNLPLRVHLDVWQPLRGIVGSFVRRLRPPRGTMLLFEKP